MQLFRFFTQNRNRAGTPKGHSIQIVHPKNRIKLYVNTALLLGLDGQIFSVMGKNLFMALVLIEVTNVS